ncbi:unnamed protein product [Rhizophagus irregularis]|nr:unnamed protein product [Rhizophagus irregularis]
MDKLQRRIKLNRNQVINAIIKCWAIVAKCSQLTFKISLTIDDRIELERYLKKEREALVEQLAEVTLCCKSQELY